MLTAIIALTGICLFITVPALIITLIYKHFYNKHVNLVLSSGKSVKRWLSPFLLFFILVFAGFLLCVVLGMCSARYTAHMYDDCDAWTMTQELAERSLYDRFNGSDIDGFTMSEETDGDFSYVLYTNENSEDSPAYVLRVTYTGSEDVHCWSDEIDLWTDQYTSSGTGTMSEFADENDRTFYVIINAGDSKPYEISYTLDLYHETMEECNTYDLGTYVMPDPAAEFTLQIQ